MYVCMYVRTLCKLTDSFSITFPSALLQLRWFVIIIFASSLHSNRAQARGTSRCMLLLEEPSKSALKITF